MCLLIASPDGNAPDLEICKNATESNPHGFGIAYPSRNRVAVQKWRRISPGDQFRLLRKLERDRLPYIAHWRFACVSGGRTPINRRLAHPFRLSEQSAIAHNGILPIESPDGSSDTEQLVRSLIRTGATTAAQAIDTLDEIGDYIRGNKLAAIDQEGQIFVHGEESGDWESGIWHSNWSGLCSPARNYYQPTRSELDDELAEITGNGWSLRD